MAIVLLFALVMALSNSKHNNFTEAEATVEEVETADEEVETVDALAMDLSDDEVALENNKVTWDFTIVKDEIYDTNNIWAEIKSDNYISQSFPYEGYTYASLLDAVLVCGTISFCGLTSSTSKEISGDSSVSVETACFAFSAFHFKNSSNSFLSSSVTVLSFYILIKSVLVIQIIGHQCVSSLPLWSRPCLYNPRPGNSHKCHHPQILTSQ